MSEFSVYMENLSSCQSNIPNILELQDYTNEGYCCKQHVTHDHVCFNDLTFYSITLNGQLNYLMETSE